VLHSRAYVVRTSSATTRLSTVEPVEGVRELARPETT
jgi:hypothetical protein